jgi:hypothetical protein
MVGATLRDYILIYLATKKEYKYSPYNH